MQMHASKVTDNRLLIGIYLVMSREKLFSMFKASQRFSDSKLKSIKLQFFAVGVFLGN